MELLPCAASSTWTWVNQLLTLVQWLRWCRTTTYYNFETLRHLGHLFERICYNIVKQYWAAWGCFYFWKRSVSPCFLGVFLCRLVFVFGWVCFVCNWKTPGFLLSPILQYVGIANQRQYVLMTVRASSVHGMSSKKKSCLALSNQQACVRPYCFTGRPRPIGTSFSNVSMVPSLWSAPSSFEIPALRVPRYRLAPVDCFFCSSVTGKAPC